VFGSLGETREVNLMVVMEILEFAPEFPAFDFMRGHIRFLVHVVGVHLRAYGGTSVPMVQ